MSEQPRDPFAPPDAASSAPSSSSFPPPAGDPLPQPAWTGAVPQAYGEAAAAPRRRRGWLIAAAVIGGVLVVGTIGFVALRVLGDVLERVSAGSDRPSISAVPPGRCYVLDEADRRAQSAGRVTLVDCASPHDGQVYAQMPLAFQDWPGDEAISAAAESACTSMERVLDPSLYDSTGLSSSWYLPSQKSWAGHDHIVQCVVQSETALGLTRDWMKAGS